MHLVYLYLNTVLGNVCMVCMATHTATLKYGIVPTKSSMYRLLLDIDY